MATESLLYLDKITLQRIINWDYTLRLFIEDEAVELQTQDNETWKPAQRPGVSPTSTMRVEVERRSGSSYSAQIRRKSVMIDLQTLFNDYWSSNKQDFTVSTVFYFPGKRQHRCPLKLQFSASTTTENLASPLHRIPGLLKEHPPLPTIPTEKVLEKAIQYWALLFKETGWHWNSSDRTRVFGILKIFAGQGSQSSQNLAQDVIASFTVESDVSEKAHILDRVDTLVAACDDTFHRQLAEEGFFQALILDEKVQTDLQFRAAVRAHLATWLRSLSGKAHEIASDVLRQLPDSSKRESTTERLDPSGPSDQSLNRGSKEVLTFQTPKLEKALCKFLLSSYIQAGDILRKSRRVKWFSLQSIHIARQAFHLIIRFNDFISPDGPTNEQYDEGMDLDDALEELEDKIDELEKMELDEAHQCEEDHKYDLARLYQIFFATRDFYPNGRDYKTDPVLKRLVDLDHATLILARCLQAQGPHTEGFQIVDVPSEALKRRSSWETQRDGVERSKSTLTPPITTLPECTFEADGLQEVGRMKQLPSSSDPVLSPCVNPVLQTSDIAQPRQPIRSVGYSPSGPNPHLDTTWAKNAPNTDPLTAPQPSVLLQGSISESQDEDSSSESESPIINDIGSLRMGIIKTSRNEAQAPYTILLVGETGTGKSSLLEFIANILIGKDVDCYDFNILDYNEEGGSGGQTQTNSARMYEFTSKNGVMVRILDVPGLVDTRGIYQNELHKKSIATEIQSHIDSVTAVLILLNGTVPRITIGVDYALSTLSTLSTLFPNILAENIAFLFTNCLTYLSLNVSNDVIPNILKGAPQFLLDNPIALQKKLLEVKYGTSKRSMKEMQRTVKHAEQMALGMLVELFDWLDGLGPHPTVVLYEKSHVLETKITNTLAQIDQASAKMREITEFMEEFRKKSVDVGAFARLERIVNTLVWKQQPASTLNYLCITPNCYSTCGVQHSVANVFLLFPMQFSACSKCTHPHSSHSHLRATWVQVHEAQVSVDGNMRKQWEAAKDKERTDTLLATSKSALEDFRRIIDEAMVELAQLAKEYARLSLSWRFSAPLEKAISFLEQFCKGMEEKGVALELLMALRNSLEEMTARLDHMRQLPPSSDPVFSPSVNPVLPSDIAQPRRPIRSVGYPSSGPNPHLNTTWAKNAPNTDLLTAPQTSVQTSISESHDEHSSSKSESPNMSDFKSLRKGIIKTSRNKTQTPYTILLVGETGTGKSSLLDLMARILLGKATDSYDFDILDYSNELGGSSGQTQINSARIYELTSKNGVIVRILDAPGLVDTRGIDQDQLHKKSIATQIQNHIESVTAILILLNGTVPRITVGVDYALSTLSDLFPKMMAKNIAFLFSNCLTYLSLNVSNDVIPNILKSAPQFLLDNPIALQKKFLEFKDDPNKRKMRRKMQKAVKHAEQMALETLVDLFDWLDGLEPHSTTEIVALYEISQAIESKITNTLAQMDQASAKLVEINQLMEELPKKSAEVDAFSHFERIITALVWKQQPSSTLNYLCTTPNCHSTCGVGHSVAGVFQHFPWQFALCSECNHPHSSHFHLRSTWEQVYEARLSVDHNMRKQWEAAKDEKERIGALFATSKTALEDLGRIIDESMDGLRQLAEEYARSSLSGDPLAPLEKAIWLLEQRCEGIEEKGVGLELLTKVRTSLEHLKGRLDLLRKAHEKMRQGARRFEGRVHGRVPKVEKAQDKGRTIEEELPEGLSILWGAIKKKGRAGFWR